MTPLIRHFGGQASAVVCVACALQCVVYIRIINLLVAWRVCGCREKAYLYMIFKHVYHEIPRQHYNELISNGLVGHSCK